MTVVVVATARAVTHTCENDRSSGLCTVRGGECRPVTFNDDSRHWPPCDGNILIESVAYMCVSVMAHGHHTWRTNNATLVKAFG